MNFRLLKRLVVIQCVGDIPLTNAAHLNTFLFKLKEGSLTKVNKPHFLQKSCFYGDVTETIC
jgi:hypothetical protein